MAPNFYGALEIALNPPDFLNPTQLAKLKVLGANAERTYRAIVAAGDRIKVVFGTDQIGPPESQAGQVYELSARAEFWPVAEVLRQATSITGELLALSNIRNPYPDGPLGVIAEGAYADMLLVDGNPLEDILLLEDPQKNLKIIMKDGVIYKNTLGM